VLLERLIGVANLVAERASPYLAKRARRRLSAAQNVVEYGLLIATIALIVLLAGNVFGHQLGPWLALLAGRVTTVGT